jgi:heat shock protein HtpX
MSNRFPTRAAEFPSGQASDLFSQQASNRLRSRILTVGFVLFFAWLGFGGDWLAWQFTLGAPPDAYRHTFPWVGVVFSVMAVIATIIAWRWGPERVLWSTNAYEVKDPVNDDERRLVNVVEEMSIASGLPRPRIWIVPDEDPNAFATGKGPENAHVAVTAGLLLLLDRDELQAVIGHELGHVKNLDVRLMTILAALVGVVALVSDFMGRSLRTGAHVRGGAFRGQRRGDGKRGNPLLIVVLVLWVVSWLLAPLVTRLLAMGVSRKREYLADAMGAQFTRNPAALARALEKIEHSALPTHSLRKSGTAHLCIADPLGRRLTQKQGFVAELLGTHPPMAIRVAKLKAMAYQRDARGEM